MGDVDSNKETYRRFVQLLNTKDFAALPEVVDEGAYREICVGAMPDWVGYDAAVASAQGILAGMPDMTIDIEDCVAEGDKVYARAFVTGTNTGSMMGMPATGKPFKIRMFDYVQVRDGRIVERVQMGDNMGMMQQIMGGMPGMAGAPG